MDDVDPSGRDLTRLYGHRILRRSEEAVSVWTPPLRGLLDANGALSVGALAYAVDAAGAIIGGFSVLPDWVVTAQMSVELTEPALGGEVRVDGRLARKGRRQIVVEGDVVVEGEGDERLVGAFVIDNTVLTPEVAHDVDALGVIGQVVERDEPELVPSVLGVFDPRPVPGGVEIDVIGRARNPWNILHGGVTALMVDAAAAAVAPGGWTQSVDLRFLSPVRTGPARATATVIGDRGHDRHLRVALVDRAADDRLCVLANVVVADAAQSR